MNDTGFSLNDHPNQHTDILLDGKIAGRYMYAYDNSTDDRLHETYKPYLHVFNVDGTAPITKGPGGLFTHHRGIFIGWNKIQFNGQTYDRWHMTGGEIIHRRFIQQTADEERATLISQTDWNDEKGQVMIEETRTMTIQRPTESPFRLQIDFTAELKAVAGDVLLDGDPEHAGVQYRPADEVVKEETIYIFPKAGADPKVDLDYSWVGETYTLSGNRHSVVQLNHPDNPKETRFSAYRDYGRFGAFFVHSIANGEALQICYRFLIADGELPATEQVHASWDRFAGISQPGNSI